MRSSCVDHLVARGFELLGRGDFADVYRDPLNPQTAIKIGHSLSDGWPAWAAFALDHPSPHVPVVYSLRWAWTQSGLPLFYIAEFEALWPAAAPAAWLQACPDGKRDPILLAAHIGRDHPGIAALLREARAAFPLGTFDMGSANWLARRDGTLVLNDPLSWRARVGPTTHFEI